MRVRVTMHETTMSPVQRQHSPRTMMHEMTMSPVQRQHPRTTSAKVATVAVAAKVARIALGGVVAVAANATNGRFAQNRRSAQTTSEKGCGAVDESLGWRPRVP